MAVRYLSFLDNSSLIPSQQHLGKILELIEPAITTIQIMHGMVVLVLCLYHSESADHVPHQVASKVLVVTRKSSNGLYMKTLVMRRGWFSTSKLTKSWLHGSHWENGVSPFNQNQACWGVTISLLRKQQIHIGKQPMLNHPRCRIPHVDYHMDLQSSCLTKEENN